MTTREKIIVGFMVLAVIYGGYTVFLSSPREAAISSGDKELEALNSFVTKVAERTKTDFSEQQAYILQKAQAAWKQDPLIQIQPKESREEQEARQPLVLKSKMLYSGFMQMGDTRLAIINGAEYEAGDRLEPEGLIVRSISPNHVVIGSADRKNKTVILPMEEIE
jgi:hypothetical protein